MPIVFRKPGNYRNRKHYPQGGRKRRIGRGVRQIQKIASDVAKVKDVVNTEYKYFDTLNEGAPDPLGIPVFTTVSGAPAQMAINDIPPYTYNIQASTQTRYMFTVNEREGLSVKIRSYLHNCSLENTTNAAARVRMVVYMDLRPNPASPPTLFDVLQLDGTNIEPLIAPRNLSNRARFSILIDRILNLEPQGVVSSLKTVRFYKKLNFHTLWERDTQTSKGNITKNALYCCYFADVPGVNMICFNRIRFIDN